VVKKVIESGNYSLVPRFETLFQAAGENSPEIKFFLQFKHDSALPVNSQLGIVQESIAK
jgi:hypothetical protein